MTVTLQALSLVENAEPVQVHFTPYLRDQRSEYVNASYIVKSTWIPTWHPMDHVFMVTSTIFKNHRETTALRTLTTANLFNFIMCEDLHE